MILFGGDSMVRIEVQCEICGRTFWREKGEVNRSRRLGRRLFCSRECTGIANIENLPEKAPTDHLPKGRIADKYSPFREYLKLIRRRTALRHEEMAVTLEDLRQLWEQQNGRCPLTGWQMELPPTTDWSKTPLTPRRASIDRIDSSVGYVPDNIRFVAMMANFCKNSFTDADVIAFCHAVAERFPPPADTQTPTNGRSSAR